MTFEDAFAGAEAYYARYRPPYPDDLVELVVSSAPARDRALDLGCGTGELALPLSRVFEEVWAVDASAEMVRWGRRKERESGQATVRWIVEEAGALVAPDAAFDLVTIGAAFHWMDKAAVAAAARRWLKPRGVIAVTGPNSTWNGEAPWQRLAIDVVRRRLGEKRRAGTGCFREQVRHEVAIEQAGFADIRVSMFHATRSWTLDDFIGYLYSTSFASKAVLGDQQEEFEAELRAILLDHDPRGVYDETLGFECIVGVRP